MFDFFKKNYKENNKENLTNKLKNGLYKSRDKITKSLASIFGTNQINPDIYEELESILLASDMGIEATEELLEKIKKTVSFKGLKNGIELKKALKDAIYELILPLEKPLEINTENRPFVILMVGVNGSGKTTSIGKLAKSFKSQNKSVILAAGDTFRAAAKEQLNAWGEKNDITVISQKKGDSASVCYDAIESAKAKKIDIVIADTAGRLPNQKHLMQELIKIKKVIQKSIPQAPDEILLVIDANIGQNTLNQVISFDEALGLTGLIITKLDGTAKGGIIVSIAKTKKIPIKFIGIGENIDDLKPFDAKNFVEALID